MNIYNRISKVTIALFGGLIGLVSLGSCSKTEEQPVVRMLTIQGISATGPYLTQDNQGRPVLCWTEQDGRDSLYRLKYAVYNQLEDTLGVTVTVPGSAGCSTSAESMGKVAFKSDGTIIAVFAKPFPKERNPYAGAIYYSLSKDNGKSWSDPDFLHSDTSHAYGRNFFDVARLKNGELAAVWLDGRFAKQINGSSLFFSKTEKGKGFEADTCLDKGTCECCRTNILTDGQGNIHLAYRGIQYPSMLSGKQVRDMVYLMSDDNGNTFSVPQSISADNWEIEGCPHSGPSLAATGDKVQAIWFTAGGGPGLYTATALQQREGFQKRQLVTFSGRHPQMIALSDGRMVMACEEPDKEASGHEHQHEGMDHSKMDHSKMDHSKMDHSKMDHNKMKPLPAAASKIVLNILKGAQSEKTIDITDGRYADHHAVLRMVDHGLLLAWVREGKSGSRIYYSNRHLADQ